MPPFFSNTKKQLTESQLKILFAIEDGPKSNAKIAKILRSHQPATIRDVKLLVEKKLVEKNKELEYFITSYGLELIQEQTSKRVYCEELREFVIRLKNRPERDSHARKIISLVCGLFGASGIANSSYAYAAPTSSLHSSSVIHAANPIGQSTTIASKKFLVAMMMSGVALSGTGFVLGDAYYSDPFVEYSLYPAIIPAELHGTSLTVNDVSSNNILSKIIEYDCFTEPIIRESNYSFDCTTKNSFGNQQNVTTVIQIKKPFSVVRDEYASECLSQHYMLPNDITEKYPYLSSLPGVGLAGLSDLKNEHRDMMNAAYDAHDYKSAKIHATIVLKYFDANNIYALTTMGNVMRDENRDNAENVSCAIAIHHTPYVSNTIWGQLSLAEDYHVLRDYDVSTKWSSKIINAYEHNNDTMEEVNYVNAMIVKANALYQKALIEGGPLDTAKEHYELAHDLRESYATWFGLGNIDRIEGDFVDALEKYQQARELTDDPTEIDNIIDNLYKPNNFGVIPLSIKNNIEKWAENVVDNDVFVLGLQFLADEKILNVSKNESNTVSEQSPNVPLWVKNNADWFSKKQISEHEFLKSIEYLINAKILIV